MVSHIPPTNTRPSCRAHWARAWVCPLVCLLACLACSAPERGKVRLEAYSWWKRPSERNAFENVLRIYNDSHPGVEVVNQVTDTNADAVRSTLTARLLAGAAPSTFQANAGADLLRWTVVDTNDDQLPSASRIEGLSALFGRSGLKTSLYPPLYDALVAGPERVPYAVPLNVHRLNVLYFNVAALAAFSARHDGSSFLERDVLCPPDLETRLADPQSKLDLKIAVGTNDSFALTLFALESVLPAVAGAGVYDDLFRGRQSAGWEQPVRLALRCVQYLSRSFLDDRDKGWADALAQVQTGSADFSVMGDWANGELESALALGEVDACPFPGSSRTFVFTSDTFPLPLAAPYPSESEAFLDTMASGEAQLEFSREKGSIPARSDVNVVGLGPRAESARADFMAADVSKVLATSGLFPPYYPDEELNRRLSVMTQAGASDDSVDAVIALLRDAQPLLERWQSRLAAGPTSAP